MAVFDMMTNAPWDVIAQGGAIVDHYFTVDTASREVIHQWLGHNRHIATYAFHDGKVLGFFNIMPLTTECGKLFERQEIKEEDLSVQHILPHEALKHAQYAYVGAIAVKHTEDYTSRQCSAALMGCMADLLLYGYGAGLQKIFANPTTFQGNKLVNRLGLRPVTAFKKGLKENDIYVIDITSKERDQMKRMSQRYAHFIGDNPWSPPANHISVEAKGANRGGF